MQLYLIRHGQSTNNALWFETNGNTGREADPELTDYGRQQAQILAEFLANHRGITPTTEEAMEQNVDGFGLTHLYSSLMVRSLDTATPIAKALGLKPIAHLDAHEAGGIWLDNEETEMREGLPGPNRAFFEERFPHFLLPENLGDQGWWSRPFEEPEDWVGRAQRFTAGLKARHGSTDDRVAVVTHGAFYNIVLKVLLGLPMQSGIWFVYNNTAITRINFEEDEIRLAYQNRVDFLPPELIT